MRFVDIVVALLQQLLNNIFDVLAYVTRFRECRGIGNGEGHIEHACKRFGKERLTRPRGSHEQDIRLTQLHFRILRFACAQPLVVVVHRHRQHALRAGLSNDVLIKNFVYFARYWQLV